MDKEGSWPERSEQRAFVEGVRWWQFHAHGLTLFPSERDLAEAEAVRRYGQPQITEPGITEPGTTAPATSEPDLSETNTSQPETSRLDADESAADTPARPRDQADSEQDS